MEQEKEQVKELIKIEVSQKPVIKEELKRYQTHIKKQAEKYKTLIITEDNKKDMKELKNVIGKDIAIFEERVKTALKEVEAPIIEFKELVKETKKIMTDTKDKMNKDIKSIETEQKKIIYDELSDYFNETIDDLVLNDYNIKKDIIITQDMYTLSTFNKVTRNSEKKKIKEHLERIKSEIDVILLEEYKDEILLKYLQNNYNFIKAKTEIVEQKENEEKAKEALKKQAEEKAKRDANKQEIISNIKKDTPANNYTKITTKPKHKYELNFKATWLSTGATENTDILNKLKDYAESLNIKLESIGDLVKLEEEAKNE